MSKKRAALREPEKLLEQGKGGVLGSWLRESLVIRHLSNSAKCVPAISLDGLRTPVSIGRCDVRGSAFECSILLRTALKALNDLMEEGEFVECRHCSGTGRHRFPEKILAEIEP